MRARRIRNWCYALVLALSVPALAVAEPVMRPRARPDAQATTPPPEAAPVALAAQARAAAPRRSIRPRPRAAAAAAVTSQPAPVQASAALPRPARRQGLLGKIFGGGEAEPKRPVRGSVCGDPAIRGEALARIRGRIKGCGIEKPVRVTEVDGVLLSTAATLDCSAAKALRKWVSTAVKPAFGRQKVVKLRVAAHYVCRTRNHKRGAKISEHGKGRAIDISGFILADGTEIDILRDYRKRRGAPVRKAHKAACGIFGTTLGPGSDGYHEDHLHFDTARHRNGAYCR